MKGSVFKRCSRCGTRVKGKACAHCGYGDFSWGYVVDLETDADGKRRQRLRSGFERRQDAERAMRDLLTAVDRGTYVEPSERTVAQFLLEEWLPASAPPRVKYDTWEDRRSNLDLHVVPRIGRVKLQRLTPGHLNRMYAELLTGGNKANGGGLSPTTVRRIHAIVRTALNDGVRWGMLERNPAHTADPPPQRAINAARRRAMRTWSADELRDFLLSARTHTLFPVWALAASTGMRRSELLGLRWSDVDLNAATLCVRQTVLRTAEGPRPIEDQKTTSSARTLHLDARTVAVLQAHRAAQDDLRRAVGRAWESHDLVFTDAVGHWHAPSAITAAFRRAVQRAGVRRIRFHDVRHTHATLLLRAGVNAKVVSERLGHSSVAFTLDTYAHVLPGMQPEAAQMFMDLVLGDDPLTDVADGAHDRPEENDG